MHSTSSSAGSASGRSGALAPRGGNHLQVGLGFTCCLSRFLFAQEYACEGSYPHDAASATENG